MEAAVCTSVAHRNVVSTYHYDIKPVRAVESSGDEGLQVEVADSASALGITDWKLYMPYHEVMALVYWQVIYRSPFQDVQSAVTQVILQLAPPANTRITRMTMYSITFAVFELVELHSPNEVHTDLQPHTQPESSARTSGQDPKVAAAVAMAAADGAKAELTAELLAREVARRRNFAIISHPDAGK
ncbi:protein kinase domain-containing protein, partial [Haematococcus lacustris]